MDKVREFITLFGDAWHEWRIMQRAVLIWFMWLFTIVVVWCMGPGGESDMKKWLFTGVAALFPTILGIYSWSRSGNNKPVPFDK